MHAQTKVSCYYYNRILFGKKKLIHFPWVFDSWLFSQPRCENVLKMRYCHIPTFNNVSASNIDSPAEEGR